MRAAVASKRLGVRLGRLGLGVVAVGLVAADSRGDDRPAADPVAVGYEIFNREWMPNDPRGHGGDGLGPAFNDTSCVACHNAGGGGGAGPVSKNIDILSASRNAAFMVPAAAPAPAQPSARLNQSAGACPAPAPSQLEPLFGLHPGFRAGKTVVLHKFGIDPGYETFRAGLLGNGQPNGRGVLVDGQIFGGVSTVAMSGDVVLSFTNTVTLAVDPGNGGRTGRPDPRQAAAFTRINEIKAGVAVNRAGMTGKIDLGPFVVSRSQRNPTPLFGLGLIDAIPEDAIFAMARKQAKDTPQTAGRVARVADGRVGRLGWKGQTANSEDFVLNACAVEVGLEVPGHAQAITPQAPRYKGPGLDLSLEECNALVSYVRSIPRPVERAATGAAEARFLGAGKAAFAKVGCVNCHTPGLGEVAGLYSDLLVHDLGDEMGDSGSYDGGDTTDEPLIPLLASGNDGNGVQPATQQAVPNPLGPKAARKNEWRTPPLWGFRDSGPYLHDGRAQTLEQAVALHGGQGTQSALQFFLLSPAERLQLEAFLKSLVAPAPVAGRREVARADQ